MYAFVKTIRTLVYIGVENGTFLLLRRSCVLSRDIEHISMEHTPVAINASSVSSKHKSSASRNALGPLLCWAVVFADIGTSVYYVPGYLYSNHDIGTLAGFFVFLTMSVFVLLAFKYAEVTHRFPQGGGVVTVAAQALNRWFGALGGMQKKLS